MNKTTIVFIFFFMFFMASPVKAQENKKPESCSEAQKVADLVWVKFVWDINPTQDQELAAGMRFNGLYKLLPNCSLISNKQKAAENIINILNRKIEKTPSSEFSLLTNYEPSGLMSDFTNCLSKQNSSVLASFLNNADRAAAKLSLQKKDPQSLDLAQFTDPLLNASSECTALLPLENDSILLRINELYSDATWHTRTKTNLDLIKKWNEGLSE